MRSKSIRIIIADDHKLIREGIKKLLKFNEKVKIVGEASNGNETLELVEFLKPDILILDLNMPIKSGLQVLEEIKDSNQEVKVILLTINDDPETLQKALNLGADGYILKDSNPNKFDEIIESILSGETYIDKRLVNLLVGIYKKEHAIDMNKFSDLTNREIEVLYYLSKGYTNNEIALELFITEKTVKNYVTSIYSKLNLGNRVKAALFAIENNIEKYFQVK